MKKLIIIILFCFASVSAETFRELQEIPKDSINAETMKIWIPVESDVCQVTVKILDKENNLIKMLLDRNIRQGYYNIFWDKKDDSGNYVDTGIYNLAIISCNFRKISQIDVRYQKGENSVSFDLDKKTHPPGLICTLFADSSTLSVAVLNSRGFLVTELVTDSLYITRSEPHFLWSPRLNIPSGDYRYQVKVNEFVHYIDFTYKRKPVKK